MTLRPYQEKAVKDILNSFKENESVLFQLSTGGGKTFIFSYLTKLFSEKNKRILILVDRQELVDQTSKSLTKFGVHNETITSKVKKPKHYNNTYVALVETAYNRLSKDSLFFRNIDLLIIDEAHTTSYDKIFPFFNGVKRLGMTATPIINKRITFYKCEVCKTQYDELTNCCGSEVMEYSRPFAMSEVYDTIVCGPGINDLIEMGNLVREITLVKQSVDVSKLEIDKNGEYTDSSQNNVFGTDESINCLLQDYNEFYKGKKVMIFTPSTKINRKIHKAFNSENVKMYDSKSKEDRKDVVNWFSKGRDKVLISTSVFCKGFDQTDVEVILMYRSTMSLALYIQIAGRAARTTDIIFKNNFYFVDYGGNVDKHQQFSDPTRDWEHIFYNGIGDTKAKKEALESVTQCDNCGCIYPSNLGECTNCKEEPKPKKKMVKVGEDYVLEPITPMPPPSGKRIVEYAKSRNEGAAFAFRIMMNLILDLFKFYNVEKIIYIRSKETGELDRKLNKIIQKCYFTIINSGLPGANRRLKTIIEKTKQKLDDYYDGRT